MIAGSAGTYEVGSREPGSIVDSAYLGAKTRNLLTVHSMTPRSTEFELIVSTASSVFDFQVVHGRNIGCCQNAIRVTYSNADGKRFGKHFGTRLRPDA